MTLEACIARCKGYRFPYPMQLLKLIEIFYNINVCTVLKCAIKVYYMYKLKISICAFKVLFILKSRQ